MADKYLRIAYKIEADLRHMRADGKTKLPTEELLCQKYDCSRQTIRASLKVLEDKGLIVKKRGSGSYLADNSAKLKSTVVFITGDKFEYINPEFISQLKAALKTEKYDLVVKTFTDAATGKDVSSMPLKYKIMIYKGHHESADGHSRVDFYCQDDGRNYYYEIPSGSFDDYWTH